MNPQHQREHRDGGGGEVIATILIAPVFVAFVVLVLYLGRQVDSRAAVRTAAETAAQAAARQRSPAAADTAARTTAAAVLTDRSTCATGPQVTVGLDNFHPGGYVTVDVTCTLRTSDLNALAAPARTLRARGMAVIDNYRAIGVVP